jgi:hypothetical protein
VPLSVNVHHLQIRSFDSNGNCDVDEQIVFGK